MTSRQRKKCKLSINVNKLATLRNSRGADLPNVVTCAADLVAFGAEGITVHPRPDGRHIRTDDVYDLDRLLRILNRKSAKKIEFNIEGFPNPTYLAMIAEIRPDQATLVPDPPEALTSNAGWRVRANEGQLHRILEKIHEAGVRSSIFIDPFGCDEDELGALHRLRPHRIELYTERYAREFAGANRDTITRRYAQVAAQVGDLGIEVNAGHDLNSQNLRYLLKNVPQIIEVSIGHAFIVESLYHGFKSTLQIYQQEIAKARR